VPPLAWRLAERFWPGPLTLVLPRAEHIPANVSAGGPSIGVRVPRHPVALALLEASGLPIAAPSANLFARPSPTTARHVLDDLDGRVDIVLDAGPTDVGVESTVLDLTQTPPRVLRPGGLTLEALRDVIPDVEVVTRYLTEDETAAGPGMLLKHYSPRAKVFVLRGDETAVYARLESLVMQAVTDGRRVGILGLREHENRYKDWPVESVIAGSGDDLEQVAHNLFAALRDLDARGVDVIYVGDVPAHGLGVAIRDRLIRAAEGRVIDV
jgi:L-threonylcarbamoyladenylate synthase